jgi:hypothetical protein
MPEVTAQVAGEIDAGAHGRDALADRIEVGFGEHGFGLWAVEAAGTFIGFTGLSVPRFTAPFTPCVEIGWRLARSAWGYGYATEAARAVLEEGFGRLGLAEIVSFTPGDRPERFAKAAVGGADISILYAEDAVAPGDKAAARTTVADARRAKSQSPSHGSPLPASDVHMSLETCAGASG